VVDIGEIRGNLSGLPKIRLVASVAQLVEQLTLNRKSGFSRVFGHSLALSNSCQIRRGCISCYLAFTRFASQILTEGTMRGTTQKLSRIQSVRNI